MLTDAERAQRWQCRNECGELVRRLDPERDRGLDPRDFDYVHEDGNPMCDLTPVATPGRQVDRPV